MLLQGPRTTGEIHARMHAAQTCQPAANTLLAFNDNSAITNGCIHVCPFCRFFAFLAPDFTKWTECFAEMLTNLQQLLLIDSALAHVGRSMQVRMYGCACCRVLWRAVVWRAGACCGVVWCVVSGVWCAVVL